MSDGFCRFCGAAAPPDARFCAGCGKALAGGAPTRAAPAAPTPETTIFEIRPLVVRSVFEMLLCVLTLGIAWVVLWIMRLGLRYRVTTERIETSEGIVSRRSRFVDLFRIEDFEVKEPFFLRMRGAGDLVIRTMDKDEAVAELVAIPDVRDVYEKLRILTRDDRSRKGVRVVEMG